MDVGPKASRTESFKGTVTVVPLIAATDVLRPSQAAELKR
jgi:hypothetical protein